MDDPLKQSDGKDADISACIWLADIISGLALHLIFHRFSPFNCCLSVVFACCVLS